MMKLKKIDYPSYSFARGRAVGATIIKSLFASISTAWQYGNFTSSKVFEVIAYPFRVGVDETVKFPLTAEGYARAKELFESLTEEGIKNLVSTWMEE